MFFILAEIILQHVDVRTHFTHIHKDVALPRLQTILFSSDLGGHFEWRTAIGGPALHAAGQVQLCEHLCLGNCFILRGGSEGKENKMLDDSLDSCIDWYVFFFLCARDDMFVFIATIRTLHVGMCAQLFIYVLNCVFMWAHGNVCLSLKAHLCMSSCVTACLCMHVMPVCVCVCQLHACAFVCRVWPPNPEAYRGGVPHYW